MLVVGEPHRARMLRVVAEDEFDKWAAERRPRGPKKRDTGEG